MHMGHSTRDIPEAVKRQLRRDAGFGCCICGNPVFQYHHIVPWADTKSHEPDNMLVLCPNHHYEATVLALTMEAQRAAKVEPLNIRNGYANGLLKMGDSGLAISVGANLLVGPGFKFVVNGVPLLSIETDEDARLLLSMDLYDAQDTLLTTIHRNEWLSGDPLPWDIEFNHRMLTVRRKSREMSLSIDARMEPIQLKGRLFREGQLFEIGPQALRFNGVIQDLTFVGLGLVGLILAADTGKGTFQLVPDPRYGAGKIVSSLTPSELLEDCYEALRELEESAA